MSEVQRQGQRAWRLSGNHVQWGLIVSMGSPTHTHQPNANEKANKEAKKGEPSQCLCSPDFCNLMATLLLMRRDSATWRLGDGRNTAAFGKEDQGWDQE